MRLCQYVVSIGVVMRGAEYFTLLIGQAKRCKEWVYLNDPFNKKNKKSFPQGDIVKRLTKQNIVPLWIC
jgi:hypothetical protein